MQASETSAAVSANRNSSQDSLFECNICLDTVKDAVVSLCGHLFCRPCLHQWLEIKPNRQVCPVCKTAISKDKVIPLHGRSSSNDVSRSSPFTELQKEVFELSSKMIKDWDSYSDSAIQMKCNKDRAHVGMVATQTALKQIKKDIQVFKMLETFGEVIWNDNTVMSLLKRTLLVLSKRKRDLQVRLMIWSRAESFLALKKSVGTVKKQVQCLYEKETTDELEEAFEVLKMELKTMKERDKGMCTILRNHHHLRSQPRNHIQEEDILKFKKHIYRDIKKEEQMLFNFFNESDNESQQNEHGLEESIEKFKNKIMEEREKCNFHYDQPCKRRRIDCNNCAVSANPNTNSSCAQSCSNAPCISTPGYSGYQVQEKNILQPVSNMTSDEKLYSNGFGDMAAAVVALIQTTTEEIPQDSSDSQTLTEVAMQLASIFLYL